jgi:hypothetical protein
VLNAETLTLKKVVLTFPRRARSGKTVGRSTLLAAGTFGGPRGTPDPTAGVVVSLATPQHGRMVIVEHRLTMRGNGNRSTGRDGGISLLLKRTPKDVQFVLKGKGTDLAALDTGNRDLTVAIEIGKTGDFASAQFVQNRNLVGKKNVYTLPKKRRRA